MAVHWISAKQALSVLHPLLSEYPAILAICSRAHSGLVRSKARLLIIGDKREEDAAIPTAFWWAEGHEALNQDWQLGDFSTWIDKRIECQAFGVTFDFEGLREMLDPQQAAAATRKLSVAGSSEWITAKAARRFMYEKGGSNPAVAGAHLIDKCRLGFVTARAVLMQLAKGGLPDNWTLEEREWDIPLWYWNEFTKADGSSQNWDRGIFAGKGRGPNGHCWVTLTDVHFLEEALVETANNGDKTQLPSNNGSNPGGRPRKEWWDDLWCAVWGQVHRGELIPQNQAQIEKAMLAWVGAQNHQVSESTVKPLARKMFIEMNSEGRN